MEPVISHAGHFRRVCVSAIATLSLLLVARVVSADPFTITSGSFAFRWNGSVPVEVSGPAFRLTNADTNPEDFGLPGLDIEHADAFADTFPVSGHIQLDLSARLILAGHPEPESGGSVLFDLVFTGQSAASHPIFGACAGCPVISATAPFQLTGDLTAEGFQDPDGVFRHAVAGSGLATVGFFREVGTGELRPFATYDFAPASATPEPGSLVLLASGVAWLSRRRVRVVLARNVGP